MCVYIYMRTNKSTHLILIVKLQNGKCQFSKISLKLNLLVFLAVEYFFAIGGVAKRCT